MAKLEDVFAQEWDRSNPDGWNKIHLYKIGDFWRAYEWSAWLISVVTYNEKVRMTTKDRKPLHVTRMRRTDIDNATYCFVGFPVKSVEKYIPERENFESHCAANANRRFGGDLRATERGGGEMERKLRYKDTETKEREAKCGTRAYGRGEADGCGHSRTDNGLPFGGAYRRGKHSVHLVAQKPDNRHTVDVE